MDLFDSYKSFTQPRELMEAGLYPYFHALETAQDTEVVINGKSTIMLGSNNYLGLTNDPRTIAAAHAALDKYGTGCSGSRFLNGTLVLHLELEKELADFFHKDAAITFSTGFQTNLGIVSALATRHTYILHDAENHASLLDASRLSFAKNVLKFEHSNMEALEDKLARLPLEAPKLIITDGVFSMSGDIAKLPEIVALKKKYNARLMVDDAHGVGMIGDCGRGTASYFNLEDDVDVIMTTFSKSFASLGGFIATDKEITNYLRHHSRSYIFTASITPASTAAVNAALDIMEAEPERQEQLWKVTNYALEGFKNMGCEIGHTETPIIPLFIRDNNLTFLITHELFNEGIFVNPVVSPAVAPTDTLIRFSLMATHTIEQVDVALDKIHKVFKSHNLIP